MTDKEKSYIDSLCYEDLLRRWRFAPVGDLMFQGETGKYWTRRMADLRAADPAGHVAASKRLGWEK